MDIAAIQQPKQNGRLLPSLTSLRVFAALFVVVHHTRMSWPHTAVVDAIGKIGWLGVSCFFILSGFVLMWGYNPVTTYSHFITRRLIRIYPLHLLCLLAALTGFVLFHSPMAGYVGTPLGTIANFFLVHDWIPGHPEIRQAWNGVSWTLSCELFFYLVAPFVFERMLRAKSPAVPFYISVFLWSLLLALSFMSAQFQWQAVTDFLIFYPIPRFVEFMLGASGALMLRAGVKFNSRYLSLAVMAIPVAVNCYFVPEDSASWSWAVLINLFVPGTFLLILSLAQRDSEGRKSWMHQRVLVYLGEASYALYMTHALFLTVFNSVVKHFFTAAQTSPLMGEMATCAFVAFALAISAITHSLIEQPVRVLLLRKLMLKH